MRTPATVVLVHGAWHGAWSWQPVIRRLRSKRVPVLAVDLPGHGDSTEPLGGLTDDVMALEAVLATVGGPIVLAGHSLGGAVITEAGRHVDVNRLVYVAAFAPESGETAEQLVRRDPLRHDEPPFVEGEAGEVVLTEHGLHEALYDDCPEIVDAIRQRLVPENPAKFSEAASHWPAWRTKPSTYAVCCHDRMISPSLQRWMADRAEMEVYELACGHMPMFAAPGHLATVLDEAALGRR